MNAHTHDVAGLDNAGIERLERLVRQDRGAEAGRRRRRQHVEPPRGDHADAEGDMTGIDEMHRHCFRDDTRDRPNPRDIRGK
jgi:hypothetical protein